MTHFESLARSICFQQLAGSAARAIYSRLVAELEGPPSPEAVVRAGKGPLRRAGLSASKASTMVGLAEAVLAGEVRLRVIGRKSDAQIVAELTRVHGIGRWTAEMFLIFQLQRPDVWPAGDYGVRKGWAAVHGMPEPPSQRELEGLGDPLRGVRSVAAWYCWRAVDTLL